MRKLVYDIIDGLIIVKTVDSLAEAIEAKEKGYRVKERLIGILTAEEEKTRERNKKRARKIADALKS